jgi:hypothetical protein
MLGEKVACHRWERWPDTLMKYVLEVRKYETLLDPIVLGL